MFYYIGDTLPGYDHWRTREPDLPVEEEPLEHCVSVELVLAASLVPAAAAEEASHLAEVILALLRTHLRALEPADSVDDCRVTLVELA